jgi:putative acetyltransferase
VRITNAADYNAVTINLICLNFTAAKVIEKMGERNVFAAELGIDLAGTISLGISTPPKLTKLHSLFVDPAVQGRGIGKLLVDHLETHAILQGIGELWLSSSIGAKAFYERLGYRLERFEERQDGSTYLMRKSLTRRDSLSNQIGF